MNIQGTLKVEIVTPERAVLSVRSPHCILPTDQGQIEVFPKHIPLIGSLDAGELIVEVDGQERVFYVEGGFFEVANDVISILTDAAFGAADFDLDIAKEKLRVAEDQMKQLEKRAATEEIELSVMEEHQLELKRARQRLAFGEDTLRK